MKETNYLGIGLHVIPTKVNRELYAYLCHKISDWTVLPYFDINQNFTEKDWNIIGIEFSFLSQEHCKNKGYLNSNLLNIVEKGLIDNYVVWLYRNIFCPRRMIIDRSKTQQVQLRIATSMLNKLELPDSISKNIFDNMIYCFYARKRAYNEYLYEKILKLPF